MHVLFLRSRLVLGTTLPIRLVFFSILFLQIPKSLFLTNFKPSLYEFLMLCPTLPKIYMHIGVSSAIETMFIMLTNLLMLWINILACPPSPSIVGCGTRRNTRCRVTTLCRSLIETYLLPQPFVAALCM